MRHVDKCVLEGDVGLDAPLLIQLQHVLEQRDERSPVELLRYELDALELVGHVDLRHVLQTVEYVLARLLGLGGRLGLVLVGRLQAPKGVRMMADEAVVDGALVQIEEALRLGGRAQHVLGRRALRLAYVAQLVVLGRAGVERPAEEELGHDAAERPHVDRLAERQAEQYLGRSVVARLQVRRLHGLGDVRGGAEVDHLDLERLPGRVDEHDVLGLEVGVYEAELAQLGQGEQHLLHHRSDAAQRQRTEVVLLEVVVQVLLEHLEDETRVTLVLEDLVGAHQIVLVGVLLAQARQDAHLDLALARIARMILEYLDGHDLVGALVPALDHLAEGAAAEELEHLVAVRHRVEDLVQHELVVALVRSIRVVVVVVSGCGGGGRCI